MPLSLRTERRLEAVACTPMFGPVLAQGPGKTVPDTFAFSRIKLRLLHTITTNVGSFQGRITEDATDQVDINAGICPIPECRKLSSRCHWPDAESIISTRVMHWT